LRRRWAWPFWLTKTCCATPCPGFLRWTSIHCKRKANLPVTHSPDHPQTESRVQRAHHSARHKSRVLCFSMSTCCIRVRALSCSAASALFPKTIEKNRRARCALALRPEFLFYRYRAYNIVRGSITGRSDEICPWALHVNQTSPTAVKLDPMDGGRRRGAHRVTAVAPLVIKGPAGRELESASLSR
jgi:hypothetical protein